MIKRLVIFGNTYQQEHTARVLSLLEYLRQRGLDIAVEQDYLHLLSAHDTSGITSFEASQVPEADMALSLGGDGTFLTTAMWVSRQGMPILGINLGHLGYLTTGHFNENSSVIDDVLAGKYRIALVHERACRFQIGIIPLAIAGNAQQRAHGSARAPAHRDDFVEVTG